jgi:exodeoxyribonuclease V alpha subunit
MNSMAAIETQLRVTSVRSRGSFGGVIFAGKNEAGKNYVVVADHQMVPDPSLVEVAQTWAVKGATKNVVYTYQGRQIEETQITPESLRLERPSGKNIVAWIASSPDCKGIGEVKARRLFERFGLELLKLIEAGDTDRLSEIIDIEAAESLVQAFTKHGVSETLLWLEQFNLTKAIASSVVRYWGKDAKAKLEANPYVLVSFCAKWKTVDEIARSRFGVQEDDPRRLIAALEDVLYRGMDAGDTAMPIAKARDKLQVALGRVRLADMALELGAHDVRMQVAGGLVQAAGLHYIEQCVARHLSDMLSGTPDGQGELFGIKPPSPELVERQLHDYETSTGIQLTKEQRQAVQTSSLNPASLILGGAGTGKTTVLKALCHVLEHAGSDAPIHQYALAGRAAQRMTQSTGRPAATIAALLNGITIEPGSTVLIDEMSMVDVILMYRLLKQMPAGVRLVLIGDPAQLPPIGPGLVLHALQDLAAVPQTTLKTVKRQSSASGIPQVAQAVRDHVTPTWAPYTGFGVGVSAIPCAAAQIDTRVAKIYDELGGDGSHFNVQVLCTTKNGDGGLKNINQLLHARYSKKTQPVLSLMPGYDGPIHESTVDGLSLFAGDLVIFGANDYTLGLRNGSLGTILQPVNPLNPSSCVCYADFEGKTYEFDSSHLRHVTHAYAITVHKSQGSQFERVIVPVRSGKLLDNALLYTAITRGVSQVVLVGDIAAAEQAIRAMSNSSLRCTCLASGLKSTDQFTYDPLEILSQSKMSVSAHEAFA